MNLPTTVTTADGSTFTIPSGDYGTYPWVRQASLIAKAYRDIGDTGNAQKWGAEYQRRLAIWDALESGKDYAAVIAQFGADLLTAPIKIAADVGSAAIGVGSTAVATVKWIPLLVIGALVVLGIGFSKGSIRVSR